MRKTSLTVIAAIVCLTLAYICRLHSTEWGKPVDVRLASSLITDAVSADQLLSEATKLENQALYVKAEEIYQKLLSDYGILEEHDPLRVVALTSYGRLLVRLKRPLEAQELFDKAKSLSPSRRKLDKHPDRAHIS